ncbi:MarR family winged helix-turn-helix transcriptional regulator [Halocella sp. SP3-1]|uniref:MarR family winged helix-turn-helix transcriptional regulator n=1 Tax=Halocella sp. SP3-1 TaxID=2382161 RepID=UPI000F751C4B|nr:MarR family winged helix-turn-helix transcriptional regulator [Halocella sp. SP3-1]AZO94262.1 MarR family transcriptional regulator [Halocella sp. SP3-1]
MGIDEKAREVDETFFKIILNEFYQLSVLDENLRIRELLIIKYLGKYNSTIMSKLTSVFATPPTTMTSIVNRLVDKGYVKRRRRDDDRRIVEILLSQKGQKFYDNHQKKGRDRIIKLLSILSEREQEVFLDLAVKMSNNYKIDK